MGNVLPSGKRLHNYGKSPCFMVKLTISMAIFNSHVTNYQRVKHWTMKHDKRHSKQLTQLAIHPKEETPVMSRFSPWPRRTYKDVASQCTKAQHGYSISYIYHRYINIRYISEISILSMDLYFQILNLISNQSRMSRSISQKMKKWYIIPFSLLGNRNCFKQAMWLFIGEIPISPCSIIPHFSSFDHQFFTMHKITCFTILHHPFHRWTMFFHQFSWILPSGELT